MPAITALPAASALAGTEPLPVVQSSTTKKATIANIATYVGAHGASGATGAVQYNAGTGAIGGLDPGGDGTVLTSNSGATGGIEYDVPIAFYPVRGVATLTLGAAVVSTSQITNNSLVFLTVQALGTVAAPKPVAVTARVASTSFTITSSDATDTSDVAWMLMEPSLLP